MSEKRNKHLLIFAKATPFPSMPTICCGALSSTRKMISNGVFSYTQAAMNHVNADRLVSTLDAKASLDFMLPSEHRCIY